MTLSRLLNSESVYQRCLEAISKLSFGLPSTGPYGQQHLLTLDFVAKTLRSYGYALILEQGPLNPTLEWFRIKILLFRHQKHF